MAFVKALRFGQYRDVPIEQVPTDYLEWVRDQQLSTLTTVYLELQRRRREERQQETADDYRKRSGPYVRPAAEPVQREFPVEESPGIDDSDIPF